MVGRGGERKERWGGGEGKGRGANWKCNFHMTPYVRRLVGLSVSRSVCHIFLKGWEAALYAPFLTCF